MATSPHLSGKLREALGSDAGEELVGIVDKAASDISELRADVAELRHEMQVGFARLEHLIASQSAGLKNELKAGFSQQLADTTVHLSDKIAAAKSDLMKWSFVFWVGAVASIAMLALALRP